MHTKTSKKIHLACVTGLYLLSGASAYATDFPARPITLVVPYSAGGSTDMVARDYAQKLSEELSQPVVVENRPGAATNIGSSIVARAEPDGYTLLIGGNPLILNPIFGPKPPFDGVNDFAPISTLVEVPYIIAASQKSTIKNLKNFIKQAAAKPNSVSISSAQFHLYVELMQSRANVRLLHVPYKGGAQSVGDAIAGHVDSVIAASPIIMPNIAAKTLNPIAVTSEKRIDALPNVPTFKEQGIDYAIGSWYGVFAPKGTPQDIIERLSKATSRVAASKELAAKLREIGAQLQASTPQGLTEIMVEQREEWKKVAKALPQLVDMQETK